MIPPSKEGYGEIARASLLAARELYERLVHWEVSCKLNKIDTNYQFVPITANPPDTNIVCFVIKEKNSRSIKRMNALSELVYNSFSIKADGQLREYSYSQPFFLSRTTFKAPNYSLQALRAFLERAGLSTDEYAEFRIFALRSSVMTPYIILAAESGRKQEYLAEFVEALAGKAEELISILHRKKN
jgi:hypothetical protein